MHFYRPARASSASAPLFTGGPLDAELARNKSIDDFDNDDSVQQTDANLVRLRKRCATLGASLKDSAVDRHLIYVRFIERNTLPLCL